MAAQNNTCASSAPRVAGWPSAEEPAGRTRNSLIFWQPHFGPTTRIPQCSFKGLTAPTAPVKSLKVRDLSNFGAEGRGFESNRPGGLAQEESQCDSGLTKARLDFETHDLYRYDPEIVVPQPYKRGGRCGSF